MRKNSLSIFFAILMLGGVTTYAIRPVQAANGDFFLSLPGFVNAQPGMVGTANITVLNEGGSSNTETISFASNDTIHGCSISPATLTIPPAATAKSFLSCTSSTFVSFGVNVTGTNTAGNCPNPTPTCYEHFAVVQFNFRDLVNLDANSQSQTDATVTSSASQPKSFRVGAVVNASSTNSIVGVKGWQFEIDYNSSAFEAQGDPDPASLYPDGAAPTTLLGAQTAANWAGLVQLGQAAAPPVPSPGPGRFVVAFAILASGPPITIAAKTLLANVNFELINKPGPPQAFTISGVSFVDASGNLITNVAAGVGVTETVTNRPPTASFTFTALPQGSSACVQITGSNCTPFAFRFDGSASSDKEDMTIANATGFFWDFGDLTQDLAVHGVTVIHDYGVQGQFSVSLRVIDSLGATGAARDGQANAVNNVQPSHVLEILVVSNGFLITASPPALALTPNFAGPIGSSTITITRSPTSGFSGTVTLTPTLTPVLTNRPTFSFNTTQVQLGASGVNASVVTVSQGLNTPRVSYNLTIFAAVVGNSRINNTITIRLIPFAMNLIPTTIDSPGTSFFNSYGLVVIGVPTGKTFSLNVTGSGADIFGWQFLLSYNSTVLNSVSATFGKFWTDKAATQNAFPVKQVNQTAGTISMAATLFSTTPFNGNTTLATLKFSVTNNGVIPLALVPTIKYVNSAGVTFKPPQFSVRSGVFCNITCPDHDASVIKFTSDPTTAKVGDKVKLITTINNVGLNQETVQLTYFAGGNTVAILQIDLTPGNSTTVVYVWDTNQTTPQALMVTVQASLLTGVDPTPDDDRLSTIVTLTSGTPRTELSIVYIAAAIAGVAIAAAAAVILLRRRKLRAKSTP